jgi:oxygen-independent coproporphyrinogen-3 oxidase
MIPEYSHAVCQEIEYSLHLAEEKIPVQTIYFGGGTPSLLPITELENILSTIDKSFYLQTSPEVSIEANPGTLTKDYLRQLHSLGVNRISLGMQSAIQEELAILDRQHSFQDVVRAMEWAKATEINNLNLDLIFGLPHQTLKSWMVSLEAALDLLPAHLSLYPLTLEHGTPLLHKVQSGILPEPDPDAVADMYDLATERLLEAGYIQYEISNWARLSNEGEPFTCKHNLQYWRNLPYLGIGAGSHGFINHYRTVNHSTPATYIKRINSGKLSSTEKNIFPRTPATIQMNYIDVNTEIGETMMMGLRLVSEGVSSQVFLQRFGISLIQRFGTQIDRLIGLGLLEWVGEKKEGLRITKRGRFLGNQVFKEFI